MKPVKSPNYLYYVIDLLSDNEIRCEPEVITESEY